MWTIEQILALAPDPSAVKAGQSLSSPRKWSGLGQNERTLWGECQGSGSKPYQVRVDLTEPAFKCTCPSRKFPCKHALGLFLMLGTKAADAPDTPPSWVTEWLESRSEKAAKKQDRVEKAASGEGVADPAAQAKRAAERVSKITAGFSDLRTWMEDLVRQGFAQAQSSGSRSWEQMAARMVDAQAPGVARVIREIGETVGSSEGWHERLLMQLGRLYLLLEAFSRLETLPVPLQADVTAQIGIPVREEELQLLPGVVDRWCVLGQQTQEEEKLRVQRSWLRGAQSGQSALVLEFAFGSQPLKSTLVCGTQFDGEIVFYPSAVPLRGMLKSRHGETGELHPPDGFMSTLGALEAYGTALSANPWIGCFPMVLSSVRIVRKGGMLLVDQENRTLPLAPRTGRGWQMLALSGGQPVGIFGEWDGHRLVPLSLWSEGRFHGLA